MRRMLTMGFALGLLAGAGPLQGQQAPLIDRELFFGDPELSGAQISPNGEYVSFRKPYNGVMNIWVKDTNQPFEAARPITADTTRPVTGYFWSHDSRMILYVQDKYGNENYHVYAVDPSASAEAATGVPPARDLTPFEDTRAFIYSVPRATPNHIIVGLNDRDPEWHDAYRLDLRSGMRELLVENTERVAGWVTDNDGVIRMALRVADDGGTEIMRVVNGALTEPVYSCSNEETCGPVRFHKDGRRVYMISNRGGDVDLARLILFDPITQEETVVESDPEKQVDFGGAAFSDVSNELMATFYVGDRVRIYPKTDEFRDMLQRLRAHLPDGELSVGSSTFDERIVVIRVSRDVDPGSTYIYDTERDELTLLYRTRPDLPSEDLAPMRPIRYTARDGLEIPAYLTVPKGMDAVNLPLVVFPHGGPWARDMWGYNPYAQFLANRGFAVLSPNFRGSTGYGKAFLNAGNNEWGTGAMQHDITDGVQYLIAEGIVNPERVAIFGGSYGGYATLAGLAFTPELYAAGVSYVGPSNLLTLLNSIPPYWAPLKKIFNVRLGNPDDPEDRERLIAQSPLFSAEKITAPLLVVQGANDPRVKEAESEQIVVAMRELGRDVEYMLAEDEGHGFAGRENRLALAAALERFLAEHIGGRHQKDMPEDIAAKLALLTVDVNTVELAAQPTVSADAATAPLPAVNTTVLAPTTLAYAATLQMAGQEIGIDLTRTVERATFEGQDVWRVVDVAVTPRGPQTDTLEVHANTLRPIRHAGGSVSLRYTDEAVTGQLQGMGQTVPVTITLDAPAYASDGGTDLPVAALPLKVGFTTTFRTVNVLMQKVRPFSLTVTGAETVDCAAGSFETFVVEIAPLDGDEAGTATLHVMRAAPHIVVQSTTRLPAMMGGGTIAVELTGVTN